MSIQKGSRVCLKKLKARKFNGKLGSVIEYQTDTGRFRVQLDGQDEPVAILPHNLRIFDETVQKNNTLVKRLAHNDKSVRDKSIRNLRKWLSNRKDVEESDVLKIWKGIFYCFWMSDKTLVQHDLADRLSEIIQSLELERGMLFMKVFYATMNREWTKIDRLRLDKYMTLVRKFTCQFFIYCQVRDWDEKVVKMASDILAEGVLNANNSDNRGMLLHVTDCFVSELARIHTMTAGRAPVVPIKSLQILLEPFYRIISTNTDRALIKRVTENVFEAFLVKCADKDEDEDEGDATEPEALAEAIIPALPSISKKLFKLASGKGTSEHLRSDLYKLRNEFESVAKELGVEEGEQEEEAKEEIAEESKKEKKKKKRKKESSEQDTGKKRQKASPELTSKKQKKEIPQINEDKTTNKDNDDTDTKKKKKDKKDKKKKKTQAEVETVEVEEASTPRKKIEFEKIFPTATDAKEEQPTKDTQEHTKDTEKSSKKKKTKKNKKEDVPEQTDAVTPKKKKKVSEKKREVKSAIKAPSTPTGQKRFVRFAYPISETKKIPKIGRLKASDFF